MHMLATCLNKKNKCYHGVFRTVTICGCDEEWQIEFTHDHLQFLVCDLSAPISQQTEKQRPLDRVFKRQFMSYISTPLEQCGAYFLAHCSIVRSSMKFMFWWQVHVRSMSPGIYGANSFLTYSSERTVASSATINKMHVACVFRCFCHPQKTLSFLLGK